LKRALFRVMDLADYLSQPRNQHDSKESLSKPHARSVGTLNLFINMAGTARPSDEELLTEYYTKWKGENSKKPNNGHGIPRFYTRVSFTI